jgi:hypothetical protein
MPREITLPAPDSHTYLIGTLDAMKQWAIAKRFLNQARKEKEQWESNPANQGKEFQGPSLESLLSALSDEDSNTVINTALGAVQRKGDNGGWSPVMTQGTKMLQFADMKMEALIALTFAVMRDNIDSFFTTEQPDSTVAKSA